LSLIEDQGLSTYSTSLATPSTCGFLLIQLKPIKSLGHLCVAYRSDSLPHEYYSQKYISVTSSLCW
jgi:hypothetical protein